MVYLEKRGLSCTEFRDPVTNLRVMLTSLRHLHMAIIPATVCISAAIRY